MFKVGDMVAKQPKSRGGTKTTRVITGEVRAVYTNRVGKPRLVVEDKNGETHIYDPASVSIAANQGTG